jgi:hypothetical protein
VGGIKKGKREIVRRVRRTAQSPSGESDDDGHWSVTVNGEGWRHAMVKQAAKQTIEENATICWTWIVVKSILMCVWEILHVIRSSAE